MISEISGGRGGDKPTKKDKRSRQPDNIDQLNLKETRAIGSDIVVDKLVRAAQATDRGMISRSIGDATQSGSAHSETGKKHVKEKRKKHKRKRSMQEIDAINNDLDEGHVGFVPTKAPPSSTLVESEEKRPKTKKHRSSKATAAASSGRGFSKTDEEERPADVSADIEEQILAPADVDRIISYNYVTVDDDHCETPREAYEDIYFFLVGVAQQLAAANNEPVDVSQLRIYDPYFCEGSMVERLGALGFMNVYNKNEDFYAAIEEERRQQRLKEQRQEQGQGKGQGKCNPRHEKHQGEIPTESNNSSNSSSSIQPPPPRVPEYDVLVTNPPYSQDHVERLVAFCVSSGKPWFLLVPNYVYMKDYYRRLVASPLSSLNSSNPSMSATSSLSASKCSAGGSAGGRSGPFYVCPAGNRRYLYTTPKGRRQQKSGKYTSPFPTFWFCHCGRWQDALLASAQRLLAAPHARPLHAAPRISPANNGYPALPFNSEDVDRLDRRIVNEHGARPAAGELSRPGSTAAAGGRYAGGVPKGERQETPADPAQFLSRVVVARSALTIPLQHASENDPRKKKEKNARKRQKHKDRKKNKPQ